MPFETIPVPINKHLTAEPFQMYRLRFTWVAHQGLSHYPSPDWYVYYTRRNRFAVGANGRLEEVLPNGVRATPCHGFLESKQREVNSDQLPGRRLRRVLLGARSLTCVADRTP